MHRSFSEAVQGEDPGNPPRPSGLVQLGKGLFLYLFEYIPMTGSQTIPPALCVAS